MKKSRYYAIEIIKKGRENAEKEIEKCFEELVGEMEKIGDKVSFEDGKALMQVLTSREIKWNSVARRVNRSFKEEVMERNFLERVKSRIPEVGELLEEERK